MPRVAAAAVTTALFFAFGGRNTESFSTKSHRPMSLLIPRCRSCASAAATRLWATPSSFRDNNDKQSGNTGFFDPLELSSAGEDEDLNSSIQASAIFTTTTEDEPTNGNGGELGVWAARGLLLLVAAIWGTNFAVRGICGVR